MKIGEIWIGIKTRARIKITEITPNAFNNDELIFFDIMDDGLHAMMERKPFILSYEKLHESR